MNNIAKIKCEHVNSKSDTCIVDHGDWVEVMCVHAIHDNYNAECRIIKKYCPYQSFNKNHVSYSAML